MAPRAIVIGTGFGGAVAACRLAQAGFEVNVLERGRRYDREGLPEGPLDRRWFWQKGFGPWDVRPFTGMQLAQGAGYGGGSLIYANVHLRAPEDVFERGWPPGYTRRALDPYYDLVAYMLDIQPITAAPVMPVKTRRMAEAARALGRGEHFFYPPLAINFSGDSTPRPNRFGALQTACVKRGEQDLDCPQTARNTLDRNYLARAEQLGARMHTLCEVRRIERRHDGPRPYYRVHYVNYGASKSPIDRPRPQRSSGERAEELLEAEKALAPGEVVDHLDAEHVFLCAGAVNSTEMLLRARRSGDLPDLSPRLGEGYAANGDLLAFGFDTREPFRPTLGPLITSGLLYKRDNFWFLVEEGGFPTPFWPVLALSRPAATWPGAAKLLDGPPAPRLPPARPSELAPLLQPELPAEEGAPPKGISPEELERTAVFLAMGRDLSAGSVQLLAGDVLHIRWDVMANVELYRIQERLCADLARALGGRFGENAIWRMLHVPISVHSLGGCSMGPDPAHGVTSEIGEVFGHENLFVLDGAILPEATGVNPSHTIAAVAERNIEQVIRRVTGNPAWVAPERALARPIPDPLAAVSQAPFSPPTTPAPGASMRVSMEGTWTAGDGRRGPVRLAGEILFVDVHRFVELPEHAAVVQGSLEIAGLTEGRAKVDHGVCNLFFQPEGAEERMLRFALPFLDSNEFPHVIDMRATVPSRPRRGLAPGPITLQLTIHRTDDPGGPLVGSGSMRFRGFSTVLAGLSIRFRGPYGPAERRRTLTRLRRFLRAEGRPRAGRVTSARRTPERPAEAGARRPRR